MLIESHCQSEPWSDSYVCVSCKLIQLINAVDLDDPVEGHHFYFSMVPDKNINPNFTIRDNQGQVQIDPITVIQTIYEHNPTSLKHLCSYALKEKIDKLIFLRCPY